MTSAPPSYPGQPAYPYAGYPGPVPPPSSGPPNPVPPPPPGPGVHAPFPAPPVEGKGKRLGWTLGIGAAIMLLICGGGLAAVIGLAASASRAIDERADKAVSGYLDALRAQRYDRAYAMLCRAAKEQETPAEFRTRVTAMPQIDRYRLGALDLYNLTMDVDATYTSGDTGQLVAYLGQNQDAGGFEVCRVEE